MDDVLRGLERSAACGGPLEERIFKLGLCRRGEHGRRIVPVKEHQVVKDGEPWAGTYWCGPAGWSGLRIESWWDVFCPTCDSFLGEEGRFIFPWTACLSVPVSHFFMVDDSGLRVPIPEEDREMFHRESVEVDGVLFFNAAWCDHIGEKLYPAAFMSAWCVRVEERFGFNPRGSLLGSFMSNYHLFNLAQQWRTARKANRV